MNWERIRSKDLSRPFVALTQGTEFTKRGNISTFVSHRIAFLRVSVSSVRGDSLFLSFFSLLACVAGPIDRNRGEP